MLPNLQSAILIHKKMDDKTPVLYLPLTAQSVAAGVAAVSAGASSFVGASELVVSTVT